MFTLCLLALIVSSIWFVFNTMGLLISSEEDIQVITFLQTLPLAFVVVVLSICVGSL